jgi:poly(A) polymerase
MEYIFSTLNAQPLWKELISLLKSKGSKAYLCGGCLRDLILGRKARDFDICISGDSRIFAREFANITGASIVPLEPGLSLYRVVKKREVEFDFSSMMGETIEIDLSRRDFTINAMAIEIAPLNDDGKPFLIDPFGGIEDIKSKRIRMVPPDPFPDDPLRLLRAFRLMAELNYEIESETLNKIASHVSLIGKSAPERIRDEFMKILSSNMAWKTVELLDSCGLLAQFLPEIDAMKGVSQNETHHLDVWGHSILTLKNLEAIIHDPPAVIQSIFESIFKEFLLREPVVGRPISSILKFASLMHDVGKPITRSVDEDGRIRFFHHERYGEEIVLNACERLKLSKQEVRLISTWVRRHMRPGHLFRLKNPSKRAVARFFRENREDFQALFLLFLADLLSTMGPAQKGGLNEALLFVRDMINLYVSELRSKLEGIKLISGNDLIEIFKLKPGPHFSEILKAVERLYEEGEIKDREDAIRWVRENYVSVGKRC